MTTNILNIFCRLQLHLLPQQKQTLPPSKHLLITTISSSLSQLPLQIKIKIFKVPCNSTLIIYLFISTKNAN